MGGIKLYVLFLIFVHAQVIDKVNIDDLIMDKK